MNDAPATNEAGLERPLAQLRSVLIPGETVDAWAIQMRLFALLQRRLLVAATSGRLIVLSRKLLGGFDVTSIRWPGSRGSHAARRHAERRSLGAGRQGNRPHLPRCRRLAARRVPRVAPRRSAGRVPDLSEPGPGMARKAPYPRARGVARALGRNPGEPGYAGARRCDRV